MLLHVAIVHLLSQLYNIPLYEHTSIYFSILLEMNIWAVLGVLLFVMPTCTHARDSLGCATRSETAMS